MFVIIGLFFVSCAVCPQIIGGLYMGWGMANSEVVQHSVVSPDGKITALVIGDDCGATCSCKMRVDLETSDGYFEEVYRSWDACDATVTWLSSTEFKVVDDAGGEKLIDVRELVAP